MMKKSYEVEISYETIVRADSKESAEQIVEDAMNNGNITMDDMSVEALEFEDD